MHTCSSSVRVRSPELLRGFVKRILRIALLHLTSGIHISGLFFFFVVFFGGGMGVTCKCETKMWKGGVLFWGGRGDLTKILWVLCEEEFLEYSRSMLKRVEEYCQLWGTSFAPLLWTETSFSGSPAHHSLPRHIHSYHYPDHTMYYYGIKILLEVYPKLLYSSL